MFVLSCEKGLNLVLKNVCMRDNVCIIVRKRTLSLFIINTAVYILLQGKSTGAVVMTEIKIVMECNRKGGLYIMSGYSLCENTIIVLGFIECQRFVG